MVCSSCDKPRANLSTKKSKLIPGMTLYMCNECIEEKREPRFVIILAARQNGVGAVKEYIKRDRYVGPEIKGKEIL